MKDSKKGKVIRICKPKAATKSGKAGSGILPTISKALFIYEIQRTEAYSVT